MTLHGKKITFKFNKFKLNNERFNKLKYSQNSEYPPYNYYLKLVMHNNNSIFSSNNYLLSWHYVLHNKILSTPFFLQQVHAHLSSDI